MYKAVGILAGLYGLGYLSKMNKVDLTYFKASEFGKWWPFMSVELLIGLDEFRHQLGRKVAISPAVGALGRTGTGNSRHNVTRWGEVQAADLQFPGLPVDELEDVYSVARDSKQFGGIGVYPHWNKPGLHVDVRPMGSNGPAKWAGLNDRNGEQYYTGIDEAFV